MSDRLRQRAPRLRRRRDRQVRRLAPIRPRRHRHAPRREPRPTPCASASTTTNADSCCSAAQPRTSPRSAGNSTTTTRSTRSSPASPSTVCPSPRAPPRTASCAASNGSLGSPGPTALRRRSSPERAPAATTPGSRRAGGFVTGEPASGTSRSTTQEAAPGARLLQHRVRRAAHRLHRRDDQRSQVQDPVPAGQRTPPLRRDRRRQPVAAQPDPHPRAAPQHPGRRPRRHDRLVSAGEGTRLRDGARRRTAHQRQGTVLYAVTPSGFEWEVGWNPIVVDETTWEPTTYQGISIWGHTPEGQTIVDKLAQFKIGARSLLHHEDNVAALAGAGVPDN